MENEPVGVSPEEQVRDALRHAKYTPKSIDRLIAALRSDSPVSEDRPHRSDYRQQVESDERWHGPASTGGERDEPKGEWAQHLQDTYDEGKAAARRELEQTPSYIHGFNAGFDEAVKQLSEECIVCGEPYVSHCEMDEPGVDHPSSCRKKHHEFQGAANDN